MEIVLIGGGRTKYLLTFRQLWTMGMHYQPCGMAKKQTSSAPTFLTKAQAHFSASVPHTALKCVVSWYNVRPGFLLPERGQNLVSTQCKTLQLLTYYYRQCFLKDCIENYKLPCYNVENIHCGRFQARNSSTHILWSFKRRLSFDASYSATGTKLIFFHALHMFSFLQEQCSWY